MRAHHHALAALDAEVFVPHRDFESDVALLPHRGAGRECPVDRQLRNRERIAVAGDDRSEHVLHKLGRGFRNRAAHIEPAGDGVGNRHLVHMVERRVHGGVVLPNHRFAALAVSLVNRLLDLRDRFLARQDAGDREEAGLHDRVDALAHAGVLGDLVAVDHIELQLFLDDLLLHFSREVVPDLARAERAVEQERSADIGRAQHVQALEERELVAGDEVRLADQVGGPDRFGTEPQVGNGDGAGLLGVVHEIALRVIVGFFADDLHRVLVRAHRAVGADAVEHAADGARVLGRELGIVVQARLRDIVVDADGEMVLRALLRHLVEHSLDHRRREFLGRKAITPADHLGHRPERRFAGGDRFAERRHDVGVQRLPDRTGLFGAVEDADGLHRRRKSLDKMLRGERPVQPDLQDADLLAAAGQVLDGLVRGVRAGAHQDQHALGVGSAEVIEEPVLTAHDSRELVHHVLHDGGAGQVVGIDGLARLEVDIGVLGGAANEGMLGRERTGAVCAHQLVVDHRLQVFHRELLDFGDLVRGAEAVEEVNERDARFERGGLRDQRAVHRFLNRVRGEHRKAGLADGHDVLLVAEDRQRVCGDGAGGDVDHGRSELARDLIHVRNHEQQTLRRREGGGERAGLQRAVQRARRAALALHLDDARDGAPDVRFAFTGPLVGPLAHGRGRRDRVDRDDLVDFVSYVSGGFIAVKRYLDSIHRKSPFLTKRAFFRPTGAWIGGNNRPTSSIRPFTPLKWC